MNEGYGLKLFDKKVVNIVIIWMNPWLCNLSEHAFKGLISGNEGGDEELAGRLKDWVGSRLSDVSVKDEHKVIYLTIYNI